MNIGFAGFLSGLTGTLGSLTQRDVLNQMALNRYQQQLDIRSQQLEKQRRGLLSAILGQPDKTGKYSGGLLSGIVNQNPYLRDVIAGSVYGINLPMPEVVKGKTGVYEINPLTGETKTIEKVNDVKFLKALDLGDRIIPLLSVNGVPTVPAEYMKGLSPEAKLKFKQWQKEYGLKVKRLGLDAAKFNWQKTYQQAQLGLDQERITLSKQKKQVTPKTVVQTARAELEELLKTHGVVDFTGNINTDKLEALRIIHPDVYNRIKYLLSVIKQANDMIAQQSGVRVKRQSKQNGLIKTTGDDFLVKNFPKVFLDVNMSGLFGGQ